MPSTTSSSVSAVFASSTVITPSLPTFFIASAIILPMVLSPFAATVPIWAISSEVCTFFDLRSMSLTTAATAMSTPRFRSIGFIPAATSLRPSFMIEAASTVAVVVPSPARSLVFEATSRTIWAPMFSNLSSSSISLATATPSLVMRGAPYDLSRMTLRPLGPSVALTALLRTSTPRSIRSRASVENLTSFADMIFRFLMLRRREASGRFLLGCGGAFDDAHDVGLLHDQKVLAVDLDFRARPLAEQHPVAGFEFERLELAALVAGPGPDGDNLAFLRLLLDGVGNDDAAFRFLLALNAADDDAVVQRTEFHWIRFQSTALTGSRAIAPALGGSPTGDIWQFLALVTREC